MAKSLNDFDIVYINNADEARKSADFDAMYDLYCKCFQLEEEQLSKEEFIELLANNPNANHAEEAWVGLKDKKTGAMVAAWNYDVFAGSRTKGVDGTIHDIFTMVDPDHREAGNFKMIMDARLEKAREFAGKADGHFVAFAEQNNPLLMTAKQYIDDTESAIDQCVRRTIFEKLGYRTLEMRYLQPPMSEGGLPNTYLDLVVQGAHGHVASDTVREHMDRFFELSFPEGTTLDHPDIAGMKHDLDHHQNFKLARTGKFQTLSEGINLAALKEMPAKLLEEDAPILGNLYHGSAIAHFGKENLAKHGIAPANRTVVVGARTQHVADGAVDAGQIAR